MGAFKGLERWQSKLAEQAKTAELRAQTATIEEAERIKVAAQEYCPVDTGELRSSARVEQTIDGASVTFTAPHALPVHERLDLHHKQGQAKFLERAVQEARDGFAQRVGKTFADEGDK